MNIRSLTAAIMLGLSTASAPLLIGQAHAADMEMQDIGEQVNARLSKLDTLTTQAYQRVFSHYPQVESIKVTTTDFKPTDTGANAKTTLTITLNPKYLKDGEPSTIELALKDNIIYNNELMDQGILARIDGEIIPNDSLKKAFDIDDGEFKQLSQALQYFAITTDLLNDGELKQVMQIKPFEHTEDGDTVNFEGLTVNSTANEENLVDLDGTMNIKVGKLTATSVKRSAETEKSGTEGAEVGAKEAEAGKETLTLYPFTADYSLQDGDLSLQTSAIKLDNSEDNIQISVDKITGSGSDVKFDDDLGTFGGKQEYVLDTVKIASQNLPTPVTINSIRYTTDTEKDGDVYDFDGNINIDFDGQSLNQASGITGMEIEDIDAKFAMDNISAKAYQTFVYDLPALVDANEEAAAKANVQNLFSDMAQNESGFKADISFNTDQGDATFVADIKAKSSAVTDAAKWDAAFESNQPTQFINLLQSSFDFDLKLSIPESLVKAAGMEQMIGMAAGYVIKDGDNYSIHIENADDGIELNGNVMPLPQQ